jgi:hypothetical protein
LQGSPDEDLSPKALGERIPKCSAESFHRQARERIPEALQSASLPILEMIHSLTRQIRAFDKAVEQRTEASYPTSVRPSVLATARKGTRPAIK